MALGVFLFKLREAFVENSLVDVRELREIFMIIGGTYNTGIMSFSLHCSEQWRKNYRLKCNPHSKYTVFI